MNLMNWKLSSLNKWVKLELHIVWLVWFMSQLDISFLLKKCGPWKELLIDHKIQNVLKRTCTPTKEKIITREQTGHPKTTKQHDTKKFPTWSRDVKMVLINRAKLSSLYFIKGRVVKETHEKRCYIFWLVHHTCTLQGSV
jgi:hypothetical protein